MSCSPDARSGAAAVLERIRARMAGPGRVLLLDGRSGSGKSTLADWLAGRLGARVLRLEDLYCGWGGLDRAAAVLADRVLPAFAAGRPASWPRWDWDADRAVGTGWLRPGGTLLVEGCGALTGRSRPFAAVALVLEVDRAVREARISLRDPRSALPGHRTWAVQERRQGAREPMYELADLVLHGGVRLPDFEQPASALR